MEVREAAACGISLREFVIEFDEDEIVDMYRILNYAQNEVGFYDEDFLDDVMSQMTYIIGPSIEEEPPDEMDETIHWEYTDGSYSLVFTEPEGVKLMQILNGLVSSGKNFDRDMNQRLMDQMIELAPTQLSNLPIYNR